MERFLTRYGCRPARAYLVYDGPRLRIEDHRWWAHGFDLPPPATPVPRSVSDRCRSNGEPTCFHSGPSRRSMPGYTPTPSAGATRRARVRRGSRSQPHEDNSRSASTSASPADWSAGRRDDHFAARRDCQRSGVAKYGVQSWCSLPPTVMVVTEYPGLPVFTPVNHDAVFVKPMVSAMRKDSA